jgi:hypothetical protein
MTMNTATHLDAKKNQMRQTFTPIGQPQTYAECVRALRATPMTRGIAFGTRLAMKGFA